MFFKVALAAFFNLKTARNEVSKSYIKVVCNKDFYLDIYVLLAINVVHCER